MKGWATLFRMRGDIERSLTILRENRPGALDRALTALQDTIYSFSMKACGHPEDAEDTMQDVLLKSISYLERFDNPRALAVWLYKVARNRCLMHRRRNKTVPLSALSLDSLMPGQQELRAVTCAPFPDPEAHACLQQQSDRLHAAVLLLPPAYREVLVLHDMEGFDYAEVAEIVRARAATVRVRLHRARLFVRRELWKGLIPTGDTNTGETPIAMPPAGNCRSLFAKLSDYLDGTLDDAFCKEMQRHLGDCPPCVAFIASLKATVSLCQQFKPASSVKLPEAMRSALLSRYEQARAALMTSSRTMSSRS